MDNEAKLILVPTPIGNLQDITLRAVEVLKTADIILAEDTRVSSKLLKHLEIDKKLLAHHKFNEHKTTGSIVSKIEQGNTVALISDAGTPAISDPGFLLVRACVEKNVKVECLPGATALIPALAVSGLPTDKFVFEGFLPQKKGRQTRLKILAEEPRTIVLYESPYRLVKALGQFSEFFGPERKACVCRELSKMFEEVKRGTVTELQEYYTEHPPKGEIVIVVEGKND
ncbi:16S rRNA (cytidine1402-2'-O)-methyltransferase [Draconibacterium orientale]|jgi:16S rRNA (cytidine1402-2'-O)-methyltransferase|uniref:Ribosomal RNA small subunit methyltransferase I n=1 Tax=Draconibacterium orientale TaxID=1168034 RepID=X5E0R8_9BACT|nr:16S rRNA (cytidine(1402)-2'-O)-methyltransferase [Draconibacterium orientale]AHW60156.1 16S rRNA methyltransferase [Draconibacterium orientale]SES98624.1 16S rRNA (cytidine1402-2'-O)-methyltransferase [Draconibacterium orientale]